MQTGKILALLSTVIVVAVVAAGIIQNPPAHQRALHLDRERLQALRRIETDLFTYARKNKKLPSRLAELCLNCEKQSRDPETQTPYEYTPLSAKTYRLCAVFALPSHDESTGEPYNYLASSAEWQHKAGHTCFDRSVTFKD